MKKITRYKNQYKRQLLINLTGRVILVLFHTVEKYDQESNTIKNIHYESIIIS